ncbi:hypothetical protein V7274_07180, partial [Bacillus pumilus]|uniref:hypothetical protein n=1 Tax=Bacillus pumilus TaxID=1408 RepID=UPI002FFDAD45
KRFLFSFFKAAAGIPLAMTSSVFIDKASPHADACVNCILRMKNPSTIISSDHIYLGEATQNVT